MITFTNAAVNELYERIQKELKECLEQCGRERLEDVEVIEKLEAAFQNIDSMHISTIHSFCLDMLKERGFDLGMSLETELLDEEEAVQQKKSFFQTYYGENYPGDENSSWEQLEPNWLMSEAKKIYDKYQKAHRQELREDYCGLLESLAKVETLVKKICFGSKKADKEAAAPFVAAVDEYWVMKQEELGEFLDAHELYRHAICMQYLEEAQKQYVVKKTGFQLSNDELLYYAKKLVTENQEARTFFQKKYRCFYVDEFQDTDPMQTEMILQLAKDNDKLIDGSLFIVGDPKQSIYGFRGADIGLYRKIKQLFREAENAEVIEIGRNYRTNEKVIDWVNAQFGIRFMNIHQSKGLEGKIVIIANRKKNVNIGKEKSKYVDREGKVWKAYIPVATGLNKAVTPFSLCGKQERECIRRRELEEFVRCEYVEATRAEEALIVMPPVAGSRHWFHLRDMKRKFRIFLR